MFDLEKCKNRLSNEIENIIYFEALPSTNDYLKENIKNSEDFTVVITTEQIKGRGRFEREWKSDKGQGIAISFLFKNIKLFDLSFYSILSAVCATDCLKRITGRDFLVKWPNDIVFDRKKICGILCESQIQGQKANVVCGIGINVNQNPAFFHENGIFHGASLYSITQNRYPLEDVAAELILSYISICRRLKNGDKKNILTEYINNCVTLGRNIKYNSIEGKAVGINEDGSLVIETKEGRKLSITAADVIQQGFYGQ